MSPQRVPHPVDEVKKAEKEYSAAEAAGKGAEYREKHLAKNLAKDLHIKSKEAAAEAAATESQPQ